MKKFLVLITYPDHEDAIMEALLGLEVFGVMIHHADGSAKGFLDMLGMVDTRRTMFTAFIEGPVDSVMKALATHEAKPIAFTIDIEAHAGLGAVLKIFNVLKEKRNAI